VYLPTLDIIQRSLAGEAMTAITKDAIEAAIHCYWAAFCAKSVRQVSECYSPWAIVYGPAAERPESGQVATMRRAREYMHPEASVTVRLGLIEIQLLNETVAVASYPYSFMARNVAKDFCGRVDQHESHTRATQVFQLIDGSLKIVHEHISVLWKVAAAGGRG
jgi:ketosteroid isomerase-like protein